jgi:8-oxo-dGTP diphosphatase
MSGERRTPELAVSAAIFRDGQVLLIQRALAPAKDLWTLPGGRVEVGETLVEAIVREIREETSLEIQPLKLAGYREIILTDNVAGRGRHFVILPFAARWIAGDVKPNEEIREARWMPIKASRDLPTTEGLFEILEAAEALARS